MNNIILIVGLPGSGKSTLAKRINQDNDNKYHIIDDPKDFKTEVLPYLMKDVIITDPQLCFEKNRQAAQDKIKEVNPDAKVDWIFFENDPESCLLNDEVRKRAARVSMKPVKDADSFIKKFSPFYTIPEGANVVEVYKTKKS